MSNFYILYLTSRGSPATGLSPSFDNLIDIETGDEVTPQPAIEEVGAGFYRFLLSLIYPKDYVAIVHADDDIADPAEQKVPIRIRFSDFDRDNKEVYVTSVFEEDSNSVSFLAFLMINGTIIQSELTSGKLEIYDAQHNLLFTLNTTSQTNGVFVFNKSNPGFTANNSFYIICTIVTSNETIKSADTFITLQ